MTTMTKKHLRHLQRYAEAGETGTCQQWMSHVIPDLFEAGYNRTPQTDVTILPTRITEAGLQALDAARSVQS